MSFECSRHAWHGAAKSAIVKVSPSLQITNAASSDLFSIISDFQQWHLSSSPRKCPRQMCWPRKTGVLCLSTLPVVGMHVPAMKLAVWKEPMQTRKILPSLLTRCHFWGSQQRCANILYRWSSVDSRLSARAEFTPATAVWCVCAVTGKLSSEASVLADRWVVIHFMKWQSVSSRRDSLSVTTHCPCLTTWQVSLTCCILMFSESWNAGRFSLIAVLVWGLKRGEFCITAGRVTRTVGILT